MDTILPMRPLAPLYRPSERFEISAEGLKAWHGSDCFRRVAEFYTLYPSRSLFNDNGRALLHHLIVQRRPERVLEIGTMFAGTTEVLARAVWEAERGHVDTIDPFGAERCPPLIAEFPPELRERVSFFAELSAMYFNEAIERGTSFDLIFIDGNHELEYAAFDLECAARVIRPGGLIILDNIEQVGPRFATKHFLERQPDWLDIAGVVGSMDPDDPLEEPEPSFPGTKNYLIEAPAHYRVGSVPRSFGTQRTDTGEIDGIELELAGSAAGTLHVRVYVRTFSSALVHSEELSAKQRFMVKADGGTVRVPLEHSLRSAVEDHDGISRRMEIVLAFVGHGGLALKSPPQPYPARYI